MSLHDAAKHLAAHGRGEDKVLVHMTKDEVKSLNDLAMAHGGSLTINPQTGLPEAGFLSAILPMALGAGLMMVPGMQAYAAAGIVGALKTAQSGSVKQGLMAGLGAYGGASMAGSFGAAGSPAVTTPTPTVTPTAAPINTGLGSGLSQVGAAPTSIADAANSVTSVPGASPMLGAPTAAPVAPTAVGSSVPLGAPGATTAPGFSNLSNAAARGSAISSGASFGNAADWAGQNKLLAAGTAGSVAAGMQPEKPKPAEPDKDMGQRYSYTGQAIQPTPEPDVPTYEDMLTKQGNFGRQRNYYPSPKTYTAISPEEAKGLYHFAGGGPVEQMSDNNAMGANTMYPMANMTTSAFATPYQDPRSTNMMSAMAPSGGGTVNQMSGEPNMQGTRLAAGGDVELHGHFSAGGGQGGGGFGGQGVNGYQAAGSGGDGNTYNPSLGIGIPPNYRGNDPSPSYQQMQQMNQPRGFGPRGPATFDPEYLATMASLRGQPSSPLAPAAPVQEAPVGIGPPAFAMANGGIASYGFGGRLNVQDVPDDQPVGPIGQLLRMGKAKQQTPDVNYSYNPDTQEYVQQQATGGLSDAHYNLGGYSDGGRLLRGPGDGVSDSIPATIGHKQPARLADGEFVVPARIVSELGNGSTEAGARKLYAMMDRVQAARKKTIGKDRVAHNSRADKYLPA
jgi:hypothetical protein